MFIQGLMMLAACVSPGWSGQATGFSTASGAIRLEQLFQSWEQAKDKTQTLSVEFTLTRLDTVFGDTEEYNGTFKLLKTNQGKWFARYAIVNRKDIYLLPKSRDKKILKFAVGREGSLAFVRHYWNPLVFLVDKKLAQEKYLLTIAPTDALYTYLTVVPRAGKPWNFNNAGRVVLMNKETRNIPRNMPREIWFEHANGTEEKLDIHKWEFNSKRGPKLEDFEILPDWQIVEWPWKAKVGE